MSNALHIRLAQINPIAGNLAYNLDKIRKVRDTSPAVTDLIVYPELVVCGYPVGDLILKPAFLQSCRDSIDTLAAESRKHKSWMVVPGPHAADGKIFNAAFIIGDGKIQDIVLKHHLPNYSVFDEARVFDSSPPCAPVTIRGHKIGVMICEDMWEPDIAQNLKKLGAEMLIAANASPYRTDVHEKRLHAARGRVGDTGLPLIYVTQVGGFDDLVFDGGSFVLNESGDIVLLSEEFAEDIHDTVWERTPTGHWLCGTKKITPRHDRIDEIYQAVTLGLRDYVTKNGFSGVMLGLSGGIDSALCAAIAVDALGPAAVHGVLLPSKYTSSDSIEDALALAKNLGISADTISIERTVNALETELATHFTPATPSIAHENIQSRARGIILMALSNANGRMVLSTSNKSEIAVGYGTLYGDMCGGYNPLKDLYKTQVYALSNWRNANRPDHGLGPHGIAIPQRSITKAPTAELRPGQTDQDSLPAYDVLDAILELMVEGDKGADDIVAKGFDRATVMKVWKMLDAAEYKRQQSCPGPKVSSMAFDRERRYPITNQFFRGQSGK